MEELRQCYEQLLETTLDISEKLLVELKEKPSFISNTLRLAQNKELRRDMRVMMVLSVKHLISTQWDSLYVSGNEKRMIIDSIQRLIKENLESARLTILLAETYSLLVDKPCFEEEGLLRVYTDEIANEKTRQNSLLGLIKIFELSADSTYLTNNDITELSNLFLNQEVELKTRELLLTLVFLFVRNVIRSESADYQTKLDQLDFVLENWNTVFQMVLASKDKTMTLMKFYVISLYICLVRDTRVLANPKHLSILPNILKCMMNVFSFTSDDQNKCNESLYLLDDNLCYENEIDGLIMMICELIENICFFEPLRDFTKNSLFLLVSTLCLFAINKEEEDLMYVKPRQGITDTISTIIDRYDNSAVSILDDLINYLLTFTDDSKYLKDKYDELKPFLKSISFDWKSIKTKPFNIPKLVFKENKWKATELALFLFDRFKEDVIGYRSTNCILDEDLVIQQLLDVLKVGTRTQLILKTLEAVSIFRYTHKIDKNLFLQMFLEVSKFMGSMYVSEVRIQASKSLGILSFKIATDKLFNEVDQALTNQYPNLFKNIFSLLENSQLDGIISAIDNFLLIHDVNSKKFSDSLSGDIIDRFMTIYKKNLPNKMTAPLFYDIFTRILRNNELSRTVLQRLMNLFMCFLKQFNEETDGHESFEQIINLLLFASKQDINFNEHQPYLSRIGEIVELTQFASIKLKFSIFIKNLILYSRVSGKPFEDCIKHLEKLFLKKVSLTENEANCCYLGSIALTLYTQTQLPNKKEFLTSLIRKLNKCSLPLTNQGIAVFISYLILNATSETIDLLSDIQVGAKYGLKILFDHWLLHQPKFTGPKVKAITVKALLRVLSILNDSLMTLYVIGIKPSHKHTSPEMTLPNRILALLREIVDHEKKTIQKNKNKNMSTNQMRDFYLEDEERLDTEMQENDSYDHSCNGSMDIDINIDYENNSDDFEVNNQRNGLAGIETGSQSYMSALLGFDDIDGGDFDENTETDVERLAATCISAQDEDIIRLIERGVIEFTGFDSYSKIKKEIDTETRAFIQELEEK